MNPKLFLPAAALFSLCLAFVRPAAAAEAANVVPLGDNTYSVTHAAKTAFRRNIDKLREAAMAEAREYCQANGKEMKVVSVLTDTPWFSMGYWKATVVFKALNPGDPELTATAPAPGAGASPAAFPGAIASPPTGSGDYYTDLLKLDDLHKRGILTDEEFNAEKKKILKRWK